MNSSPKVQHYNLLKKLLIHWWWSPSQKSQQNYITLRKKSEKYNTWHNTSPKQNNILQKPPLVKVPDL